VRHCSSGFTPLLPATHNARVILRLPAASRRSEGSQPLRLETVSSSSDFDFPISIFDFLPMR
jgi:hypothetical protein